MQKSGFNVPYRHENRIRISDLLFASTLLFVTEITKNALSLRITVLVELRLCLLICSTERKTGLQQHHVKIRKYGICMEYRRFVPFHKYLSHSIFHTDFFLPFHIPFHTIVCPGVVYCFCQSGFSRIVLEHDLQDLNWFVPLELTSKFVLRCKVSQLTNQNFSIPFLTRFDCMRWRTWYACKCKTASGQSFWYVSS